MAERHVLNLRATHVDFVFIEEDRDRFVHLSRGLQQVRLGANIAVSLVNRTFAATLDEMVGAAEMSNVNLPPSFVMVDPFGFEGVPMKLLQRIAAQPHNELLISFMYESVNRWVSDPANDGHFDDLFGCRDWRAVRRLSVPNSRREFLLDLYVRQLHLHGLKYIRHFEMRDRGNRTEYFLVFGTNNIEGLKVMKEAMWKEDPTGRFLFSDATNPAQLTLFRSAPDYSQLASQVFQRFTKQTASIEEVELFVLEETAFRDTHLKNPVLRPSEQRGDITVLSSSRKGARGYPPRTILRFNR
jgi:three-Cys-motif partner protein